MRIEPGDLLVTKRLTNTLYCDMSFPIGTLVIVTGEMHGYVHGICFEAYVSGRPCVIPFAKGYEPKDWLESVS